MVKNKYGNKKIVVDGIKFDSTAESLYYRLLKRNGVSFLAIDPIHCKLQDRIVLQDSFDLEGKKIPAIEYRADFVIYENGKILKVIDVKGYQDSLSMMKMKMFAKRYGFAVTFVKLNRKTNKFEEMSSFESATQQRQRQAKRRKEKRK